MTEDVSAPKVRWAGIVFGILFGSLAIAGVALLAAPDGSALVQDATRQLLRAARIEWIAAAALLGLGVLGVAAGVAGTARRRRAVGEAGGGGGEADRDVSAPV